MCSLINKLQGMWKEIKLIFKQIFQRITASVVLTGITLHSIGTADPDSTEIVINDTGALYMH